MYITISVSISSDGYMDDTSASRYIFSSPEDFQQVDILRSKSDAILVGAETVRRDNPSLKIKDTSLMHQRIQNNLSKHPTKVTITNSGNIPLESNFIQDNEAQKIILIPQEIKNLQEYTKVCQNMTPIGIIQELENCGINNLLIEWGGQLLEQFLQANVVDTLRVAISPIELKEKWSVNFLEILKRVENMSIVETETLGRMKIHHYRKIQLMQQDIDFLKQTEQLATNCPPTSTAYNVGVIIQCKTGEILTWYSRETWDTNHAEEEAIYKAEKKWVSLVWATLYSSLEPCSHRNSKSISCSQLIIKKQIQKVVFSSYEGTKFVANCTWAQDMKDAGIEVVHIPIT